MGKTKKVRAAGSFGPRYGLTPRRRYADIISKLRVVHTCPVCSRAGLKRVSTAVFSCKKCGARIAGGAYLPSTSIGKDAERIMTRAKEGEKSEEGKNV